MATATRAPMWARPDGTTGPRADSAARAATCGPACDTRRGGHVHTCTPAHAATDAACTCDACVDRAAAYARESAPSRQFVAYSSFAEFVVSSDSSSTRRVVPGMTHMQLLAEFNRLLDGDFVLVMRAGESLESYTLVGDTFTAIVRRMHTEDRDRTFEILKSSSVVVTIRLVDDESHEFGARWSHIKSFVVADEASDSVRVTHHKFIPSKIA